MRNKAFKKTINNYFLPQELPSTEIKTPVVSIKNTGGDLGRNIFKIGIVVLGFGAAGLGVYYLYKKCEKADSTTQDIRKDDACTNNTIKVDNAHTKNIIETMQVRSEIKINEHKELAAIHNRNMSADNSTNHVSLRTWINDFASSYPMPDYSNIYILDEILSNCPDGMKPAMLFSILSSFGSLCFSRVRSLYNDEKMHAPNIMVAIEGESGAGKGDFKKIYDVLFTDIIKSDCKKYNETQEGCIIQTIGINVSAAKFFDIMKRNRGVHIFAMETEIDNVKKAFSKRGSLSSSYLRNAFDNDEIYYDSRLKEGEKGSAPVYMNCVFTGTPNAFDKLFTQEEAEGGTARRFCFAAIPEVESTIDSNVSLPDTEVLKDIKQKVIQWQREFCYQTRDNGNFPCDEYEVNLDYVKVALGNWINKQFIRAGEDRIKERRQFAKSFASVAFNCAIVLHMLAGQPDSSQRRLRKTVKELTIYIANHVAERFIAKFAKPVEQSNDDFGNEVDIDTPPQPKRKLTYEEVEQWYYLRGTTDENCKSIGYGTIAKILGVTKNEVMNAFRKYKKGKVW